MNFYPSFMKPENHYLKITFYQMHHQIFYAFKVVFLHFSVLTKYFAEVNFRKTTQTLRNSQKLPLLR